MPAGYHAGMRVTVELFGTLRLRAGRERVVVEARTVGAALLAVEAECPELAGYLMDGSRRLRPEHRVAINGGAVTGHVASPVVDGDAVVVISAQAGG